MHCNNLRVLFIVSILFVAYTKAEETNLSSAQSDEQEADGLKLIKLLQAIDAMNKLVNAEEDYKNFQETTAVSKRNTRKSFF